MQNFTELETFATDTLPELFETSLNETEFYSELRQQIEKEAFYEDEWSDCVTFSEKLILDN